MEGRFDNTSNCTSDFVLNGKEIVETTVISLRPTWTASLHVEQFGGYASPLANAPHGTAQYVANSENSTDLLHACTFECTSLTFVAANDIDCPGARELS